MLLEEENLIVFENMAAIRGILREAGQIRESQRALSDCEEQTRLCEQYSAVDRCCQCCGNGHFRWIKQGKNLRENVIFRPRPVPKISNSEIENVCKD